MGEPKKLTDIQIKIPNFHIWHIVIAGHVPTTTSEIVRCRYQKTEGQKGKSIEYEKCYSTKS